MKTRTLILNAEEVAKLATEKSITRPLLRYDKIEVELIPDHNKSLWTDVLGEMVYRLREGGVAPEHIERTVSEACEEYRKWGDRE